MQTRATAKFLRLKQIIGQHAVTEAQAAANRAMHAEAQARSKKVTRRPLRPRPQIDALLPVSATMFWELVKQGIVPPPIKVGGSSLWTAAQIDAITPDVLKRAKPQQKGGIARDDVKARP